ncbi:MAG: hypothetical protein AAGK78_17165, partial [Planctomycetota bacterium]
VAARGRDPWVFRCTLDGRPRVIVVALGQDLWAAYDATTCNVYKVWSGDINLTGSVYDTRHGPQPKSVGTTLEVFGGSAQWQWLRQSQLSSWRDPAGTVDEQLPPAGPAFKGYGVIEDQLTLDYVLNIAADSINEAYPAQTVRVRETPEVIDARTLRRSFEVEGLEVGVLRVQVANGVATVEQGGGDVVHIIEESRGSGDVFWIEINRNGSHVIDITWPDEREKTKSQEQTE